MNNNQFKDIYTFNIQTFENKINTLCDLLNLFYGEKLDTKFLYEKFANNEFIIMIFNLNLDFYIENQIIEKHENILDIPIRSIEFLKFANNNIQYLIDEDINDNNEKFCLNEIVEKIWEILKLNAAFAVISLKDNHDDELTIELYEKCDLSKKEKFNLAYKAKQTQKLISKQAMSFHSAFLGQED